MDKEQLDKLLALEEKRKSLEKELEKVEEVMSTSIENSRLIRNKTYRFIHNGKFVVINTMFKGSCPQINLPEIINTDNSPTSLPFVEDEE